MVLVSAVLFIRGSKKTGETQRIKHKPERGLKKKVLSKVQSRKGTIFLKFNVGFHWFN